MRFIASLSILFVVNAANAGGLIPIPPQATEDEFIAQVYGEAIHKGALDMINELSSRRRSSVLFPNEQSSFHGVQMNFVNVAKGNLTFLTRDRVIVDKMPLVFGRVYDSDKISEDDFGPGWKLSFTEIITKERGDYIYRDSANSTYRLTRKGQRLYSPYPHLTGIKGGEIQGNSITLTVNDLTKSFDRHRNQFLLSTVRHSHGGRLKLIYADGLLTRVEGNNNRSIAILRNPNGQITSVEDHGGRKASYRYNGQGQLVKFVDISGGEWSFSYDNQGVLSRVVDAREATILQVTSRVDRKITAVNSQFDSTSYRYSNGHTQVTNGLSQTARFWHHESGLTQATQDWAGVTSQLELDDNLTVSGIAYDDQPYATLKYAENGHVAEILNARGAKEKRSLSYDAEGRLVSIRSGEQVLSEYLYDGNGNVVLARSSEDERAYRYAANGTLDGFIIGEASTQLKTDEIGQITQLTSGNHSLSLNYDRYGKVRQTQIVVDESGTKSVFNYASNGLRNVGRYTVNVEDQKFAADYHLDYDAAANFVSMKVVNPDGGATSLKYDLKIGIRNELLEVASNGNNVKFQYDELGRPVVLDTPHRNIDFHYDKVGRLSDVYMDSEHLLTSDYEISDVDPAISGDKRTPYTYAAEPVTSSIYGSLESIVYTRKKGTPYGAVRFDHFMARFILPQNTVPGPDAVLYDSLRRRNFIVASSGYSLTLHPLLGFDKPSNVLFIPPEFFSVNCLFCVGTAVGYSIQAIGSAIAGQPVTIESSATVSSCDLTNDQGMPLLRVPFAHSISFGDGTTAAVSSGGVVSPSLGFSQDKTYNNAGNYVVSDVVVCGCAPLLTVAMASKSVTVAQPTCEVDFSVSSPQNFKISTTPSMPTINTSVTNLIPSNATVSWSAQIKHTAPNAGGACSGGPVFDSPVVTGSGSSFSPAWSGFYGGDLEIRATCSAPGYASDTTTKNDKDILGTEPTTASKGSYIGTVGAPFDSADLRRVACHESSFKQFQSTGLPLYSGTGAGDVGLMQICFQRTNSRVWSWKSNVDFSRQILTSDDRNGAKNWLDSEVTNGAAAYSNSMWRREAIHRYNAGCCGSGNRFWEWDATNNVWIGVEIGGAPGYSASVLAKGASCTS